jgi:deoxyguanosine kinase
MEINLYNTVFLSIGSNQGERMLNIQNTLTKITDQVGEIYLKSPIYENPPLDFEAEMYFYNLCVGIKTKLNPQDLLFVLQKIEFEIGRNNKTLDRKYSSRIIDIDIIFFNDIVFASENLTIPHLLFRQRNFVLKPLRDIASMFIDPSTGFTVDYLYSNCKDKSVLLIV